MLSFITDKVLKGLDDGLLTGMILIDLQKAFDTIDHEILLQKLKARRFSESVIKRFKSYLSDRIFLAKISWGVPQGSIIGHLLFLIFVNNMPQTATSTLLLYVAIHVSYTNIRTSCKSKNNSMKTLKTLMTGLLITN